MNTSMTINATAPWLLALYVAVAEPPGVDTTQLEGTTQNDVLKEYLSGHLYFSARAVGAPHHRPDRLHRGKHIPGGTPPISAATTCRKAGATPTQELAYALSTAIAILDAVRDSGQIPADRFAAVVGRISFRQCRHSLCRGDLQDARLRRHVGTGWRRALRRER